MESVGVLMSIRHGEPFVREQLDSIAGQVGVMAHLIYHLDDADADADARAVESFSPRRRVPLEPRRGVPAAYLELLDAADDDHEYWAFADQDDVWEPEKLLRAVTSLDLTPDVPTLWVSRVRLMTGAGTEAVRGEVFPAEVPVPALSNALVENIAPGCSMVWNRKLHQLLRSSHDVRGVVMHDAWVYLVACALGRVVVDPEPLVNYRLHDSNTIGITNSLRDRVERRVGQWRNESVPTPSTQARALLANYGAVIGSTAGEVVSDVAFVRRRRLAHHWRSRRLRRQARLDNALLLPALITMPRARVAGSGPLRADPRSTKSGDRDTAGRSTVS